MSRLLLISFATLLMIFCSGKLSNASPSGSREPVTYLSRKVPSFPPLRDAHTQRSNGSHGGDVRDALPAIPDASGEVRAHQRAHQRSAMSESVDDDEVLAGEEDYYQDEDIYGLAHFWQNMIEYAHMLVDETNATLTAQLTEVNDKIEELESSLAERDEEVAALREAFDNLGVDAEPESKEPSLGDVRLIDKKQEDRGVRGRLLIYAGEELQWGYVCDDMFYSVEATVACKQLGYPRGVVDVARDESLDLGLSGGAYTIVLDDVRCLTGDADLMSCQHEPVGIHNCVASEAVRVMCYH